nr:sporozoite surface protein 2-like [Arachis hypogaea]
MDVLLDIMFHHGGNFEKDGEKKLRYTPDNLTCLGDLDEDTLDVFFIRNYYKELGYDKILHYYLQDQEEKVGMDNTGVDVAEEEGATVTPNDKMRNPSNQSPQNKPTPVNTIDIPNPPINPIPPTNPTPPTKSESLTNPKPPSQEKPLANSNDQSQAKPPNNQKPKPPTNPKPKPPTNQKPKPPTNSKLKPPTKPILPKSVSIATPNSTSKSTLKKKMTTTTHNFRPCTRSVAKEKAVMQARHEGGDALSSYSYDSDKDSLYNPRIEDSSSDDDDYDNDICKAKTVKKRHQI